MELSITYITRSVSDCANIVRVPEKSSLSRLSEACSFITGSTQLWTLFDHYLDIEEEARRMTDPDERERLTKAVKGALKSAGVVECKQNTEQEALVAACNVVDLESDLNKGYHTNFGIRCSTVDELIQMAGEALKMPMPTDEQRAVIRDSKEEKQDWLALFEAT